MLCLFLPWSSIWHVHQVYVLDFENAYMEDHPPSKSHLYGFLSSYVIYIGSWFLLSYCIQVSQYIWSLYKGRIQTNKLRNCFCM